MTADRILSLIVLGVCLAFFIWLSVKRPQS